MSYGPGASLGGGLQVCSIGQVCSDSNPIPPGSPSDGCNNGSPDPGNGDNNTCSAPSGGTGGGDSPWDGMGSNGNGGPQYSSDGLMFLPYWPRTGFSPPYFVDDLSGSDNVSCHPPPGTAPAPVPGPENGNPYDLVHISDLNVGSRVSGLSITCLETGGSQTSTCSPSVFYHSHGEPVRHYTTPGGSGTDCDPPNQGQSFNFTGASNTSSTNPDAEVLLGVSRSM